MTCHIEDLKDIYKTLSINFKCVIESGQFSFLEISHITGKIRLIDNEIIELTNKVNDLNLLMLENKVELNEDEKHELENVDLSNKILRIFSPYILCYQIFHQNEEKTLKEKLD